MKRIITYYIEEKFNNYTIDRFLKEIEYPHAVIVQLKKTENGITLNGSWAYTRDRLRTGDELKIQLLEPCQPSNIPAVEIPLDIVYEDEDILVINKPADMPIHPSLNNYDNTLANGVMNYYSTLPDGFVYRCINRLDRDTTGLTIIAKNSLSGAILGRQVANKTLSRTYLAICQGKVDPEGTIDAPIARVDDSVILRCVREDGERAITHYSLLDYNEDLDLSLVQLVLETGRTHQIRVHMKHIGHPLIGDFLYNPNYDNIGRQALHSYSLEFIHPVSHKKMHLHANLPIDMKCIFQFT